MSEQAGARKPVDLWDLGGTLGVAAIGTGVWWLNPAASLIVVGFLVLVGCLMGSRRASRSED